MRLPRTEESALVAKLLEMLNRPEDWEGTQTTNWKHVPTGTVLYIFAKYGFLRLEKPVHVDFGFWNKGRLKRRARKIVKWKSHQKHSEACQSALKHLGMLGNMEKDAVSLDFGSVGSDAPARGDWMN